MPRTFLTYRSRPRIRVNATEPSLLTLALAEAPHAAGQEEIASLAARLFAGAPFDVGATLPVFANAGIERRTLALPLAAYAEGLTSESRNGAYLEVAGAMLRDVAARAVPPEARARVTHVVTVSNTGVATPALDCDVIEALDLNAGARRVPVFGLGCAGGVAGLQLARDLARSAPDALVLLLCVELTSLTLLAEDKSRRNFIACALFGDGAAAALVGRPDDALPALATPRRSLTRLFPASRDLMGWDVLERGWRVVFSPRIPGVVQRCARELVAGVADVRPRHFALHPGGRKVLDAYRAGLGLSQAELAPASEVLARHGNMSAATVFFVLDRILRAPDFEPGACVAAAFGPGFTADLLALDLHRRP